MVVKSVSYIVCGTDPDYRVRLLGVGAVFLDTVTTLYVLYFSGLASGEFNPLAALMQEGFVGEVAFMAVPLFNILLLLYLPGLLGDAVAVSNIVLHLFGSVINIVHAHGVSVGAVAGVSAGEAYVFTITFATGLGVIVYLPRLIERWKTYERS